MTLHENIQLYRDAVRFTAQQMNLKPEYVEKDYWVTKALFTIFTNEIGKDTILKGGTALSKCYKMIDRFSEDIDLVVLRRDGETDSKLKSKSCLKIWKTAGANCGPLIQATSKTWCTGNYQRKKPF